MGSTPRAKREGLEGGIGRKDEEDLGALCSSASSLREPCYCCSDFFED